MNPIYCDDVFADYNWPLEDQGGIGGCFQVTIVNEDGRGKRAYAILLLDNDDGEELFRTEISLSLDQAYRLIQPKEAKPCSK